MSLLVNEGELIPQNGSLVFLELSVLRWRIFKVVKSTILKAKVNSTLKKYVELEGDKRKNVCRAFWWEVSYFCHFCHSLLLF